MAHRGEDLYEQHAQLVYRYLFSLCRDADLAEELCQETFCQALRQLGSFRGDCTPQVWLCAHRQARGTRSWSGGSGTFPGGGAPGRSGRPRRSSAGDGAAGGPGWPCTGPCSSWTRTPREVIHLRLAGDFSFRDIGDILDRSEVWARVRFYRGKEELARIMGGDRDGT